ncbi:gag-protease polyprotein [Trifolium medium]|uniref:Gag-protease polyprotein n=1 Tax=Trifolium medium TaxID=97028 RepID=A0A392LWV8_9FABA|nr:gag-protease polyprotein [Trifolium medium]
MSKLQILTTQFENLKMKEEESVEDFHMNVLDLANSFESLGEQMPEEKLVRKMLRSLPKRFDMKVTAIEEAQDISTMKIDELVGSLKTFELSVNEKSDKKVKSIAFASNTSDDMSQEDLDTDADLTESIALLGRQFNRVLSRMERRNNGQGRGQNIRFNISKQQTNQGAQGRPRVEDQPGQFRSVQCFECEGHGHTRPECPTYLKRQKKGLAVTWSDDESEGEMENEVANHVTALSGICKSDSETCNDEVSYGELLEQYNRMHERNGDFYVTIRQQKETISILEVERDNLLENVSQLKGEISALNCKLISMGESLNNSSVSSKRIPYRGGRQGYVRRLGSEPSITSKHKPNLKKKVVPEERKFRPMLEHRLEPQRVLNYRKNSQWYFHYCGEKGHIQPYCYKRHGYPRLRMQPMSEWRSRGEFALIAHTSLGASSSEDWYFDSGCSKHMTGVGEYLKNVKPHSTSYVTFGDEAKGQILGSGCLVNNGLPKLDNVLLVRGLKANLISISQLCDQGMEVNFNKGECLVTDILGKVIMKDSRSKDNCYLWEPNEKAQLSTCLTSKLDEAKLWHQKTGTFEYERNTKSHIS